MKTDYKVFGPLTASQFMLLITSLSLGYFSHGIIPHPYWIIVVAIGFLVLSALIFNLRPREIPTHEVADYLHLQKIKLEEGRYQSLIQRHLGAIEHMITKQSSSNDSITMEQLLNIQEQLKNEVTISDWDNLPI